MFYLTNVDDDLTASGGSRDPLGLQPVWSFFGRELVPSLTTVSTRSHHFSRLLVALSCRDAWLADHPDTELRGADSLVVFEELHAYSLRAAYDDIGDTPGKRRVEANHDNDPGIGRFTSAGPHDQRGRSSTFVPAQAAGRFLVSAGASRCSAAHQLVEAGRQSHLALCAATSTRAQPVSIQRVDCLGVPSR